MKRLTIAIPTYHRPQSLMRLLGIIKLELASIAPGVVDVLVSDNSNDEETREKLMSSEFVNATWLVYKKNDFNIGFDNNILKLFSEAKGDYVWLVGDDDIIYKSSVQKVLELIELNPDMLHLPFQQPQALKVPQYQQSPRIKHWTTMPEAVEQILKYIKITSFVYRRKVVDVEKLGEAYGKTGWMHLALGLEVLMNAAPVGSITLAEFLAGSLDTEWKSLDWTPEASLLTEALSQHDIFKKFNLNKQIDEFKTGMYLGGIQMTLLVTSGSLSSNLPRNQYFDFGAKYPFKGTLLLKPFWLLKYIIVKLRLGPYFGGAIKLYQRLK